MDVTISIVNYNSSDFIIKAIETIIKYTKNIKFEIIVTNNSPEDKGFYKLSEKLFDINILFVDLGGNFGFSRANNIAFEKSKGKYFLVYNPDMFLKEASVDHCWNFMESNPDFVCCTTKFQYPDGRFQPSAFYKQKGAHLFYSAIPYVSKYLKPKRKITSLPSKDEKIVDVDVVCGAFLFIRSSVYSEIKGFDENFFLYGEDWEISNRIRKIGKIALLNTTEVIHEHGGASKKEFDEEGNKLIIYSRKGIQMFVSILLWQRKEFGKIATLRLHWLIMFGLFLSFLVLLKNKFRIEKRKNWILYFKSCMTFSKEVFFMIFNKQKVYKTM